MKLTYDDELYYLYYFIKSSEGKHLCCFCKEMWLGGSIDDIQYSNQCFGSVCYRGLDKEDYGGNNFETEDMGCGHWITKCNYYKPISPELKYQVYKDMLEAKHESH